MSITFDAARQKLSRKIITENTHPSRFQGVAACYSTIAKPVRRIFSTSKSFLQDSVFGLRKAMTDTERLQAKKLTAAKLMQNVRTALFSVHCSAILFSDRRNLK